MADQFEGGSPQQSNTARGIQHRVPLVFGKWGMYILDTVWESPEPEYEPPSEAEDWRGDQHLADWPENLAGPEYWFYKRLADN